MKHNASSELFRQGTVAALVGVFIVISLVAMFTTSRVVTEKEWIGMTVAPLAPDAAMARGLPWDRGNLVVEEAEGIAARAGVREADVLLRINGTPVSSLVGFARVTEKTSLPDGVILDVFRNGTLESLIVPGKMPPGAAVAVHPDGVIGRKWLGVEAENFTAGDRRELGIPPGVRGVMIDGVAANSRAERAGLLSGDVIVSVNGQLINTTPDLWRKLGSLSVTAPLAFRVYRDGRFTSVLLAGDSATSVGGFFPGGAGRGFGGAGCRLLPAGGGQGFGGGCFLCPGCGLTRPAGGVGNNLACPGCGARMCWRRR